MVPRGLALLFVLMVVAPAAAQPRLDALGDPLPPGAVARLGTLRLRQGDGFAVQLVLFSPDGKAILTASVPWPQIHLWDAATGKELRPLAGAGKHPVAAAAFSPDGTQL